MPLRAQNQSLVDENPKQGLVGRCAAPLHSCRIKGEFYNDRTLILLYNFIQKEEPLVPRVIHHYAISTSLHMRSHFSFGFQYDQVFTCAFNRIRKGINHPFQSGPDFVRMEFSGID